MTLGTEIKKGISRILGTEIIIVVNAVILGVIIFQVISTANAGLPEPILSVNPIKSQVNSYTSGPTLFEVIVNDSDIADISKPYIEPVVKVNDKILRMVQADDGKWYGYFTDLKMAQIADSTTNVAGEGLDFGTFCDNTQIIGSKNAGLTFIDVLVSDTEGIAVPGTSSGGMQGSVTGGKIASDTCAFSLTKNMTVISEPIPVLNNNTELGQIGIFANVWPFIQLYNLPSTGDVLVNYTHGVKVESEKISMEDIGKFVSHIQAGTPYGDGKKFELQLKSGSFTPPIGFQTENIIGNRTQTETENFFFLQTTRFLVPDEIKDLEHNGITLLDSLNGFVYIASANDDNLGKFLFNSSEVYRSAIHIEPKMKMDLNVQSKDVPSWVNKNNDEIEFIIYFQKQLTAGEMMSIVNKEHAAEIEGISAVSALRTFKQVEELSEHSAIKFITYGDPLFIPEIFKAKNSANINSIKKLYNLTGDGVVALIFDAATVVIPDDTSWTTYHPHDDMKGRVIPVDKNNNTDDDGLSTDHSFHVAGILGGDGLKSGGREKGVAPKVQILSWGNNNTRDTNFLYDSPGDLESALVEANNILGKNETVDRSVIKVGDRIDLMNISMGYELSNCTYFGKYTASSEILDDFVNGYVKKAHTYPQVIITKSVGNKGNETNCDSGTVVSHGTVVSPATAKNPIVIGSIDSENNTISYFSSSGPTDDERIKPDLVAPGRHADHDFINSTGAGNDYIQLSGTSMASALVGGLVALMEQEWEEKWNNSHLYPHTAKNILIHTAKDLGEIGPDYKYGWGLVDGENAIRLINDTDFVNNKVSNETNITIKKVPTIIYDSISYSDGKKVYSLKSKNLNNLKVTLVWDDPTNTPYERIPHLLTDLDLGIMVDNEKIFYPFLLHGTQKPPSTGVDKWNNVEMISIDPKNFKKIHNKDVKIVVNATKLFMLKDQDFTLIVSEEDLKVDILAGNANKGEQLPIKLTFTTMSGASVENVNYDIKVTQDDTVVLNKRGEYIPGNTYTDRTKALPVAASYTDPVNVTVTFKGYGSTGNEMTGPVGKVTTFQVVPEFGTITMMILAVLIISIIVITAKSKLNIIPRSKIELDSSHCRK